MDGSHPKTPRALVLCLRPPVGQKGVRRCLRHRSGAGRRWVGRDVDSPRRRALVTTSAASTGYAQTKASPARVQLGIPGPPSAVPGPSEHPRKMRAGADSASKQGHREQRGRRRRALLSGGGERLAASGRLPLSPRRLRPLSLSQLAPLRYFRLSSSQLAEARLP